MASLARNSLMNRFGFMTDDMVFAFFLWSLFVFQNKCSTFVLAFGSQGLERSEG